MRIGQAEYRRARFIAAYTVTAGLIAVSLVALGAQVAASGALVTPDRSGPSAFGPANLGRLRLSDGIVNAPPAVVRASLRAAPLAWEPFLAAGLALARDPRSAPWPGDAPKLFGAARVRNPHATAVPMAMLSLAAQRGDVDGVIGQLAIVQRLNPSLAQDIVQRLGARLASVTDATATGKALGHYPGLVTPFLAAFVDAQAPAPVVRALLGSLSEQALVDPQARVLASRALVQIGDYTHAREIWQENVPGARLAQGPVYSPDFADLDAPPPFGWNLAANDGGAAQRDGAGGIVLTAYGHASAVITSQLINLAPGSWHLRLDYTGISDESGGIGLRLRCLDDGVTLATTDLGAGGNVDLGLSVPAGHCVAQALELYTQPSEAGRSQQLRVRRIDVVR